MLKKFNRAKWRNKYKIYKNNKKRKNEVDKKKKKKYILIQKYIMQQP